MRARNQKLEDFGDLLQPEEAIEPILAKPVRRALLEWLTEIWARDELAAVGIEPRSKALFHGAPGTGKTTLAHHLAARLGLPMLAVRPDRIQTSFVSESAKQIGVLFDAAAQTESPLVLFFDEFDSLAEKRTHGSRNPTAERDHNHTVNTLLRRFDAHDGFVIAATNYGGSLDQAIWRRFDIQIGLDIPGQFERERILARYLNPYGLPRAALEAMAAAFETASPALMRQFCENLKRQIVIGPKIDWDMRREAVVERILAAVEPHPDLGKPRLWSQGSHDSAIRLLPWPLPLLTEIRETSPPAGERPEDSAGTVVPFNAAQEARP